MSASSDVKIIVAGLPRTSTTSLKKGLEILGVTPCFHLGDPPAPISRVKESARVLGIQDRNERLKALKKLYDGFEAVFEPPASALVDDMLTIYPNAKVRINYLRLKLTHILRSSSPSAKTRRSGSHLTTAWVLISAQSGTAY
ncbi:hypothetical protein FOXYSP1_04266 [Fusarium oxysporum f. sp. phaseoli]